MAAPKKRGKQFTVRAQLYGDKAVDVVIEAMDRMNARAGTDLSHAQFVEVLARHWLASHPREEQS